MTIRALDFNGLLTLAINVAVAMNVICRMTIDAFHTRRAMKIRL